MYVKRTLYWHILGPWDPMDVFVLGAYPVYTDCETNTLYKHSPIVIGIIFILQVTVNAANVFLYISYIDCILLTTLGLNTVLLQFFEPKPEVDP